MIRFQKDILANGLTLLYHHDPNTPFVITNLLYKVGARNEHPERTGFAHLFEHLMFGGTKIVKNFDHPLQEAGGINNAFTSNDYTDYYIKLPKENLDIALFLEADRMTNLDINPKSLKTQQKVVVEEFKETHTNKPYGDVWHLLREMVYTVHPYRWPTIGKDYHHISEASLDDVVNFYNTFYHPSNAIMCIAGNLSHREAVDKAIRYFGHIEDKPQHNGIHLIEPEQTEPRSLTVHRDVPLNALYIAFKMPGRNESEYYTADLLTDILSGSKSARLPENLVRKQQLFVNIDAYITGSVDTGMFMIEGRLREGVDIKTAEAAVWHELDRIREEYIADRELEKVKNKLLTYMQFSDNNLMSRAIGLCFHEWMGDAEDINHEEEKYMAISSSDVREFGSRYLVRDKASTLYYLKSE